MVIAQTLVVIAQNGTGGLVRVWTWLGRHDPGFTALRRAGRAAIVMPTLFAFSSVVIGNADVATFAAFGSFAMLMLVDFRGPMRERIQAQVALAITGAVFVCLGTLASSPVWLAAVAMAAITFAVLFVGTVSSVLASASTSLLLAFILPVTLPGSLASIGPRLAGWGLASVVGIVAIIVLWPAPVQEPLRAAAARACRALAQRLRADVAYVMSDRGAATDADHNHAIAEADAAVTALHTGFLATPYRPTGLSTSTRTVVRLVDELNWLQTILSQSAPYLASASPATKSAHRDAGRVKSAAANVLECGADLLAQSGGDPGDLDDALASLTDARHAVEAHTTAQLPARDSASLAGAPGTTGPTGPTGSTSPAGPAAPIDTAALTGATDPTNPTSTIMQAAPTSKTVPAAAPTNTTAPTNTVPAAAPTNTTDPTAPTTTPMPAAAPTTATDPTAPAAPAAPIGKTPQTAPAAAPAPDVVTDFISSLDPSFRAQELSYAVSQVGNNIALTAAAERRTWWDQLLGRQPGNLVGTFSAGIQRATAQLNWRSTWLHNSIRGAAALGIAVVLADLTGVQHSFWVVLGTLSVLRSNALSTGQNAVRGILGTVVGVVVGAALLLVIGSNTTVLWILLPIAILVAGVAPAAISFAAGQAGFTVILVLLFNIIAPTGWTVGLLRIEDIAIGCGVSLVVGLLFWPRGAAAALRQSLAQAYEESVDYLTATVAFGVGRCDATATAHPAPTAQSLRAAAASRRLDDTFRTYLAERGAKRLPLAQVTASVTGIAGMRLASDAILDIWQGENGAAEGDRSTARRALGRSTEELTEWYRKLGDQLIGERPLPSPEARDPAVDAQLADAVRHDLTDDDGRATPTAVRIIWTGDYLDGVRRLQSVIVGPVDRLSEDVTE